MEEESKLKLLATFSEHIDASLARQTLEENGIPCMLTGENMASVYPSIDCVASLRLYVFEQDYDKSLELLEHKNI